MAVSDQDPQNSALLADVAPVHTVPRSPDQTFDGEVIMSSVWHGAIVNRIYQLGLQLVKEAQDLNYQAQMPQGEFEPRMLRVPGLLLTAIWLKALGGQADCVVPLHTRLSKLPEKWYSMDNFLKIVQPLAEERLASRIFD
jgi:hypothetical protein